MTRYACPDCGTALPRAPRRGADGRCDGCVPATSPEIQHLKTTLLHAQRKGDDQLADRTRDDLDRARRRALGRRG